MTKKTDPVPKKQKKNSSAKNGQYRAPALEKGLDILEYLSQAGEPLTLTEVSKRLERSKNEIFRMVSVLESRGYIRRLEGEQFVPTDKLFQLGMRTPDIRSLNEIALPIMDRLSRRSHYSCHLSILRFNVALVSARVEAPEFVCLSIKVGHQPMILESSSGFAILAWMNPDDRKEIIGRLKKDYPHHPRWEGFEERLEVCRRDGVVQVPSYIMGGAVDLTCPVIDPVKGYSVAALSIPYVPLSHLTITQTDILGFLKAASMEIGEQLSMNY